jgi:protein FAM50
MAGMGDGYVGTGEDSARIRRMDKKRQEQKKQFEDAQRQRQERIEGAGLRKFDSASTEARGTEHESAR